VAEPARRRAVVLFVLLAAAPAAGAATVRMGLVVGNNLGLPDEVPLQYAEEDARRMRDLLVELGGFDADRLTLLPGRKAEALQEALLTIRGRVAEAASRGDQVLLVFYFSGHGADGALHLGPTRIDRTELHRGLERTGAASVVAIVDACHSGRIARRKGGVPDSAFDVTLVQDPAPRGMVLITSSFDDELSQEAPELRGSLFTHSLISALRGEADYDGDGRVTVREAYRSAYNRTLSRSATLSARRQHPVADVDLAGHGELVLTFLRKRTAAIRFGDSCSGRYMIIEPSSGRVVAEVQRDGPREVAIAVPTGSYRIVKQERAHYLVGEADLIWGGEHHVDDRRMRRRPYQEVASKGGLCLMRPNRIALHTEVVDGVLPGMEVRLAGGVGYERFFNTNLSLGCTLAYTRQSFTFDPGEDPGPLRVTDSELILHLVLTHRFSLPGVPFLSPSLGLVAGYAHGWQQRQAADDPDTADTASLHLAALGPQVGLEIRLPAGFAVALWGRGSLAWTVIDVRATKGSRGTPLISNASGSLQNIFYWSAGAALGWSF